MPGSIIYQLTDSLKRITVPMLREKNPDRIKNEHIPVKRGEAKRRNIADKFIYSYKTYENYRDSTIVMGKWMQKEYGIKELKEITPEMLKEYYEDRIDSDLSPWTLAADYSAVTKLNNALKSRNWIQKDIQPDKDSIDFPIRKLENRQERGPFTEEEFEQVLEEVKEHSPATAEIMIFVHEVGARYAGSMQLTADQVFQGDENKKDKKGKFFVEVIEKGGRERKIEISESYYDYLQEKIEETNSDNPDAPDREKYVFPEMTNRNINDQIEKACEKLGIENKKLHGIRGLAAMNVFKDLIKMGYSQSQAKDMTSNFLGHNSNRSIANYVAEVGLSGLAAIAVSQS
ncbi:MAG: tyrosine-type recombinase/integrase [Candidatus Woesearchaeota archaeon]